MKRSGEKPSVTVYYLLINHSESTATSSGYHPHTCLCAHGFLREVFALHLMLMTRYGVKAYLNLVNAIYCFCKPNSITYTLGIWNLSYLSDSQHCSPSLQTASKLTHFLLESCTRLMTEKPILLYIKKIICLCLHCFQPTQSLSQYVMPSTTVFLLI